MLVYPFSHFNYRVIHITSPLAHSDAQVYLVGIPLKKSMIEEVKEKINDIVNFN